MCRKVSSARDPQQLCFAFSSAVDAFPHPVQTPACPARLSVIKHGTYLVQKKLLCCNFAYEHLEAVLMVISLPGKGAGEQDE